LIGTRFGYLPEIIREQKTGYLVDDVEQACQAVERLSTLDPAACRENIAERFSAPVMARGYERVYRELVTGRHP